MRCGGQELHEGACIGPAWCMVHAGALQRSLRVLTLIRSFVVIPCGSSCSLHYCTVTLRHVYVVSNAVNLAGGSCITRCWLAGWLLLQAKPSAHLSKPLGPAAQYLQRSAPSPASARPRRQRRASTTASSPWLRRPCSPPGWRWQPRPQPLASCARCPPAKQAPLLLAAWACWWPRPSGLLAATDPPAVQVAWKECVDHQL